MLQKGNEAECKRILYEKFYFLYGNIDKYYMNII